MSQPPARDSIPERRQGGRFATTQWSVVLAAAHGPSPGSAEALAALCHTYWYPLYAFVRRQGHRPEDAQDLTQEFFARLLEKDYLRVADAERGRFRCFLLAAFKHFLSKERDRAKALKRGEGLPALRLDFQVGEERYHREPAHDLTAEKVYERRWALTLLDQVLAAVEADYVRCGKHRLFDRLKGFLTSDRKADSYAAASQELAMTEGAVKVAVYRLRRRYRLLLRATISQTVAGPDEVDEELRHLSLALASH
jgi:RNA polymerase sigma-70 factor (ECF subfamily)